MRSGKMQCRTSSMMMKIFNKRLMKMMVKKMKVILHFFHVMNLRWWMNKLVMKRFKG